MTASPGTSLSVEFFPKRIPCRPSSLTAPTAAAAAGEGHRRVMGKGSTIDAGFRRPVIVSLMSLAIGGLLIRETKGRCIRQDF